MEKACKIITLTIIMIILFCNVVMAAGNWKSADYSKYDGYAGDGSGGIDSVATWNSNIQDLLNVGKQSDELMNTRYTNALIKALAGGKMVTNNTKNITKKTLTDYKDALSNMKTLVSNLEDKVNVDKLSRTNKQHREKSIEETKEYISTLDKNIKEKEKEINDANTETENGGTNSGNWKTADVTLYNNGGRGKTFLEFQKEANKLLNVDPSTLSDDDLDKYFDLLMEAKRSADQITTQDEVEEEDLETLRQKLIEKINQLPEDRLSDEQKNYSQNVSNAERGADSTDYYERTSDTIYIQPDKDDSQNAGDSLDDMFNDADDFINSGNQQYGGNSKLQQFSNMIYNILLAVGVVVAVIVGAIIGIKLMASNIDTKVEAKKLLIPYVIGCVVVFGGFAIWKIVVSVLQGM